jgi:hypothetical protein
MTARSLAARAIALLMCAAAINAEAPRKKKELTTSAARLAFIQQAQVWTSTPVGEMDLRAGPPGAGAFAPDAAVSCRYVERKLAGTTRKFECTMAGGDVVKVRYGDENGKVQGAVIASRLLWALGFGADGLYPVRVTCTGCSADPWKHGGWTPGQQLFSPATIERKPEGHAMNSENDGGWSWPELDQVQEQKGGATLAQRDALKLLAVFMQHTDNKILNERLLCLPKARTADGGCDKPFMMLHDVGLTFGRANVFNRTSVASVNFAEWTDTPIWRDGDSCVGHMSRSMTGTLGDPVISEAGRKFLADLLVQLTDGQLHDLFEVARVDLRSRRPDTREPPASVDEWVAAFKHKRDEIAGKRCSA